MRVFGLILAVVAALVVSGGAEAKSKSKGKAKPASQRVVITDRDVSGCSGVSSASAQEQVALCTKIINSGRIKNGAEGEFYATRGAAYFTLKQYEKSLADYTTALTYRRTPQIYFERALVEMSTDRIDQAKADLAQAMKLRPEFAPSYFMRGLISYNASEFKEAIGYFDNAVQRLPTYHQALYARGLAKKKAGDTSGGERDIKDAKGISVHADADMAKLGLKP